MSGRYFARTSVFEVCALNDFGLHWSGWLIRVPKCENQAVQIYPLKAFHPIADLHLFCSGCQEQLHIPTRCAQSCNNECLVRCHVHIPRAPSWDYWLAAAQEHPLPINNALCRCLTSKLLITPTTSTDTTNSPCPIALLRFPATVQRIRRFVVQGILQLHIDVPTICSFVVAAATLNTKCSSRVRRRWRLSRNAGDGCQTAVVEAV